MEPIIYTLLLPSWMHNHAFLSACAPCRQEIWAHYLHSFLFPCPSNLHPSTLPHTSLTLPVFSPFIVPLSPSCLRSLTDIMSSHYLHSSCCSSPATHPSPLSLPFPPLSVSHLQIVTYYLHHSLHLSFSLTHAHLLSLVRSEAHSHTTRSSIWTDHLNSQQSNGEVAHFKKGGHLWPPKQL